MASGFQSAGARFNFSENLTKVGMIAVGGLSGGLSSVIAGGNFWDGMRQGLITSALNHATHEVFEKGTDEQNGGKKGDNEQNKKGSQTLEEMLQEKLSTMKIGDKMPGEDFNFLNEKASLGIKSVERVSEIKFKVNPTIAGNFVGIKDDAYILIEPNKTIAGNYFDKGYKSFSGIKITTYHMPTSGIVTGRNFNSFVIHGNHGYFNIDSKRISSWQITD